MPTLSQDSPPESSGQGSNDQSVKRDVSATARGIPSSPQNPYPGLRPFRYDRTVDESIIFKGRSRQVHDLLKRLSESHLVAVVGPSGCGKSSLVLAGLIPELEAGHIYEAGSEWRSASMRPGLDPLGTLAKVLAAELSKNHEPPYESVEEWKDILSDGQNGLIEFHRRYQREYGEDTNLLLVVDQFEELFRYDRLNPQDVNQLIGLVLNVFQVRPKCLYIVITMRTDYYENCALFLGLPEALNKTQFLTPRLNRSDLREAIEVPPRLFDGEVATELRDQLMREMREAVGYDPDLLPLMQHVLMWMWNRAKEVPSDRVVLDCEDYRRIGGLKNSLSKHADEIYGSLSKSQKKTAKVMFRLMGEMDEGGRIRRRIASRQEICDSGGQGHDIDAVVRAFGGAQSSFIRAVGEGNDAWDVTHECFIRQWRRLRRWVEEESYLKREFLALADAHATKEAGKRALLDPFEIARFNAYRLRWSEHPEWGERYRVEIEKTNSTYDGALAFLEDSARERKKQSDRRTRTYAATLAVMTGLAIFGWTMQQKATRTAEEALRAKNDAAERAEEAVRAKEDALRARNEAVELQAITEKQKENAEKEKLLAMANAFSKEARYYSSVQQSDVAMLMAYEAYRHLVALGEWRDTGTICATVHGVFKREGVEIETKDMLSWFCETTEQDDSGLTPDERLAATKAQVCNSVAHNISLGQWYSATSRDLGTFQVTCPNLLDGVYIHALERLKYGVSRVDILEELDKAAEQSEKFRVKLGTDTRWRWSSEAVVNRVQTLYVIWQGSHPDRLEAHGGQIAGYILRKWVFPVNRSRAPAETYSASHRSQADASRDNVPQSGAPIVCKLSRSSTVEWCRSAKAESPRTSETRN